jgi:hypothetical protein
MVVTCAFYGFVNRATKVALQVDRDKLAVGQAIAYEGDNYTILSVSEADGHYHANVGLGHLYRARTPVRLKTAPAHALTVEGKDPPDRWRDAQEAALHARLKTAEASLQDLLREREEVLRRLEEAIQQLDRIRQNART